MIAGATLPDWLQDLDERVFLSLNGALHDGWAGFEDVLSCFNGLGNAFLLVPLLAALLVLSGSLRSFARRAVEVGVSQAVAAPVVTWLKSGIGRARPSVVLADAFADGHASLAFGENGGSGSMPSGHAVTVFAFATVLAWWAGALAPGWRRTLGRVLPFVLAAVTGVARVYAGMHFPLDVVAGALLGTALALAGLVLVRVVASVYRDDDADRSRRGTY